MGSHKEVCTIFSIVFHICKFFALEQWQVVGRSKVLERFRRQHHMLVEKLLHRLVDLHMLVVALHKLVVTLHKLAGLHKLAVALHKPADFHKPVNFQQPIEHHKPYLQLFFLK